MILLQFNNFQVSKTGASSKSKISRLVLHLLFIRIFSFIPASVTPVEVLASDPNKRLFLSNKFKKMG